MGVIWAIAANTFRETVRQRLFVLILILTAAATALLVPFPFFAFSQETDMFKDLALQTATLAMVFLVALVASSTVAEEMESRTAVTVLAKPVARWQFLVGKYLGTLLALLVATAVLAAVLFLATYLRVYFDALPQDRRLAFTMSQSSSAREFRALMLGHALAMLPGSAMMFYQGAVLASVAVVLASRFSRLLAVIVTFGLFLAGHLSEFLVAGVQQSADAARWAATWAAHLLPFLETFNITGRLSHSALAPASADFAAAWAYTAWAGLYALAYVLLVLVVGVFLLRRREIA